MEITQMFINDVVGEKAQKGDSCTFEVDFRIRPSDKLYKIVPVNVGTGHDLSVLEM
jgi:putative protease